MKSRYADLSEYEATHLVGHLLLADLIDDAFNVLTDLRYVEEKIGRGMARALVKEFELPFQTHLRNELRWQAIELLGEAVGRQIEFLSQHPQTTFQCVWNSAFHTDAALSAKRERNIIPTDDDHRQRILSQILDTWKSEIEYEHQVWLQSLQPPLIGLEGGKRIVISRSINARSAAVLFTPNSQHIVGTLNELILVWDAATGAVLQSFDSGSLYIRCLACSSDGTLLAGGTNEGNITLWNMKTGAKIRSIPSGNLRAVCFTPDALHLVGRTDDGMLSYWLTQNGALIHRLNLAEPDGSFGSELYSVLVMLPNGREVVLPRITGVVEIWDVARGVKVGSLRGHSYGPRGCSVSGDGRWLVTSGGDRTVRIWDLREGGQEKVSLDVKGGGVGPCVVSADAEIVAYVRGPFIRFLDRATTSDVGSIPIPDFCDQLIYATDRSKIAISLLGGDIVLVDEKQAREIGSESSSFVDSMVFHPIEPTLAAAGKGVELWDAATGTLTNKRFDMEHRRTKCVAWSGDGAKIAATGSTSTSYSFGIHGRQDNWAYAWGDPTRSSILVDEDSIARIWDYCHDTLLAEYDFGFREITALALSWGGKQIAVALTDGQIVLLALRAKANGRLPFSLLPLLVIEHEVGRIWSLAFSRDSTLLAGSIG